MILIFVHISAKRRYPWGEWLSDNEPVILVRVGNEARIYPIQILTWDEILTMSFCPLCNTGVVFRRSHSGFIRFVKTYRL